MPKFKSLFVGYRVVFAGKKRKCYHNANHQIAKGDIVLEVRENLGWKGYCNECAIEMFDQSARRLADARIALQTKSEWE
jgi:hypothetical protein